MHVSSSTFRVNVKIGFRDEQKTEDTIKLESSQRKRTGKSEQNKWINSTQDGKEHSQSIKTSIKHRERDKDARW